MVRLRCTLFGRLVRERRDRRLTWAEQDFLRRHTLDCSDCRATMHISDMCLDALSGARLEPEAPHDLSFVRLRDDRELAAAQTLGLPIVLPLVTAALTLGALLLKLVAL